MRCAVPALIVSALPVAAVVIINPSFEDITGESQSSEFTFGPLNGWDLYEGTGLDTDGGDGPSFFIGTLTPQPNTITPDPDDLINFPAGAPDGLRVGIAFNFGGTGDTGEYGFQQSLAESIAANTRYDLRVEIGNIASGQSLSNGFFDLNGFPGYRIALLADGVEFASDENGLTGIAEGTFETATLSYTTGTSDPVIGSTLGIRLVNLNDTTNIPAGNDIEVDFDNVQLTATAIPEPSAYAVFLGLTAFVFFLRRRRKPVFPALG